MQPGIPDINALSATYTHARRLAPDSQAIVVLQLGDDESMLAWGTGDQPMQHSSLPIGLSGLAKRLSPNARLSEMAMEQIIAEVEDLVMPLHANLPDSAKLFSEDARIAEIGHWSGMTAKASQWQLGIDAVEHLFNRQVALAQGRPASQDDLPTTGQFSAALLVLREWLHHLRFDAITVLGNTTSEAVVQAKNNNCRS